MKKVNLIVTVATALSLSLFSCSSESVEIAKKLQNSYEYEGKTVELTGEFDAPFFTFSSGQSKTIPMAFVVKPGAMSSEKESISDIVLPQGADKNSVTLELGPNEKKYTLKNFNVFDDKGEKYNLDQHQSFKIKGKVHYAEFDKPEADRRADNFALQITDVTIEKN
ncbi:hypothetical protein U0035_07005 [Niabella yanshanensis]|uniref:Lipoprotein n=1 Tax=Niabella yanshanensis TaxID=577386 RepID=A0ABZ0WBM3_9BACT|nr:hypothetical protein [Niabella yanshanensis]WQD39897.1 hypothetical protein U0035_07005 [Niabella yanshanensis]